MKRALLGLALSLLVLAGCVSTQKVFEPPAEPETPPPTAEVFHVVQPGETLYRIAKTYGVPVEDLMRVNDIADPTRVEVGRRLMIPGPGPAPTPGAPTPSAPGPVGAAVEGWAWPVDGPIISRFGARSPGAWHTGLDIKTPAGADVRAARDGEVTFAGRQGRYGQLVVIHHGDALTSWYAHLQDILVEKGAKVRRGDRVGRSGASGNASGPHLHFEIRRDGKPIDPLTVLPQ